MANQLRQFIEQLRDTEEPRDDGSYNDFAAGLRCACNKILEQLDTADEPRAVPLNEWQQAMSLLRAAQDVMFDCDKCPWTVAHEIQKFFIATEETSDG